MTIKYIIKFLACFALALGATCLAGCSKNREFKVEGTLQGNLPDELVLERLDAEAGWVKAAVAKPDGDGGFELACDAPEYPDLYRIECNGKYVYLPVDSTETFTLSAKADDISRGFTLSGSPQADAMTAFEAEAWRIEACNHPDSTAAFKRRVYERWLKDARGNMFSYYVLMRPLGDGYFIDYTDPIYRAVATSFQEYKPDDPHTPLLVERARLGLGEDRKRKGKSTVIKAPESTMVEIKLPGKDGKDVSLSSVLGRGKPVILVFGGMTMEGSPGINMALRKLYDAGAADIYQVCLDSDRFQWLESAKSLPWTVVWDPEGADGRAVVNYNVRSLPAFFVYNAKGELVNSTLDIAALPGLLP